MYHDLEAQETVEHDVIMVELTWASQEVYEHVGSANVQRNVILAIQNGTPTTLEELTDTM